MNKLRADELQGLLSTPVAGNLFHYCELKWFFKFLLRAAEKINDGQ